MFQKLLPQRQFYIYEFAVIKVNISFNNPSKLYSFDLI